MSWVRIESSVSRHRKFQRAGPAASWLWMCGLCYCQEGLTDGFIPCEAIRYLGVKSPGKLVPVLVQVGLWDQCDGGWRIHDYLEHQKSAAAVNGIAQERRKNGAAGGRASGEARRSTGSKQTLQPNAEAMHEAMPEATIEPRSDQNRSDQNRTEQSGVTRARGAPLHDTSHRKHAFCGRICMPAPLFDEFVRRRNSVNADDEILDWAIAVDKDWADGGKFANVEPGEPYAFWKARYAEKWPAPSKADSRLPAWARPSA